jgi:hypothetical protein
MAGSLDYTFSLVGRHFGSGGMRDHDDEARAEKRSPSSLKP